MLSNDADRNVVQLSTDAPCETATYRQAPYRRRFFALAAVLVTVIAIGGGYGLGASNSPTAAASAQQLQTRVAFIDLELVFDESNKKKAKQVELQDFISETETELKNLEAQHKELKDRLGMMKPDAPQARELEKQIVGIEAQVKFQSTNAEERLQRRWDAFRGEHIEEIRKVVEDYSRREGIDVVLQKQLPKQPNAPTWQMVFWSKPELDVTGPILARLNGS